jgi:Secretion system C-terminal sorting domain
MKIILSFALFLFTTSGFSTHIRAGYISAKPLSCLKYEITIRFFTNPNSPIRFGDGKLDFGDGTSHKTPDVANSFSPDYLNVGFVEYKIDHEYQASGAYIISYTEANRNELILNMPGSVALPFYTRTYLNIEPARGCLQTPVLLAPAAFTAPLGNPLNISFAASANEDLIFRYELVNPLTILPDKTNPEPVPYTLPENASINKFNGLFTWDTRFGGLYQAGIYAFAIKISYWSVTEGINHFVGSTLVDTQIILEDFDQAGSLTTSKDFGDYGRVHIPVGGTETIKVIYKGIDNENIELNAYTDLSDTTGAFSFTTYDSTQNFKIGLLTINSLPEIDREEPYVITVRGMEKPEGFGLYYPTDVNLMLFTRDVFPEVITSVHEDLKIQAYPNPVSDKLTLRLPVDVPVSIGLLDMQGRKLGYWNNAQTIDMTSIPPGIYLMEIIHSQGRKVLKIIKQ